jgi:hypothetical protein
MTNYQFLRLVETEWWKDHADRILRNGEGSDRCYFENLLGNWTDRSDKGQEGVIELVRWQKLKGSIFRFEV